MIFSIELINEIANVGYNLKRDSHNRIIFDEVTEPLSRLQWPMNHSERRVWMRRRNSPLTDPNRKPRRRSTLLNILTKRRGRARSHLLRAFETYILFYNFLSTSVYSWKRFLRIPDSILSPTLFNKFSSYFETKKYRATVVP